MPSKTVSDTGGGEQFKAAKAERDDHRLKAIAEC